MLAGLMLAPWQARADAKAVDGRGLGLTETVLKFCEKKDPSSAPKLKERIKVLENGASNAELAKVRSGPDYVRARQSMDAFLGKVDAPNVARVCSGPGTGSKPTAQPAATPLQMLKPAGKDKAAAR